MPNSLKDKWPSLESLRVLNDDYDRSTLEDVANGVTLRSDLHHNLDAHAFVLYPKGSRLVAHFLREQTAETACNHFHNVPILLHKQTSIGLVFARYIYNIFSKSRLTEAVDDSREVARLTGSSLADASNKRKRDESSESGKNRGGRLLRSAEHDTELGDQSAQFSRNSLNLKRLEDLYPDFFRFQYPELGALHTVRA